MIHKRWLEIGSGLLLLLTLLGAAAGYRQWQIQRARATLALDQAMEVLDAPAMREAVLRGADVRAVLSVQGSPVNVAAIRDDTELLRLLLERGADPNTRDSSGMTPLMYQPSLPSAELLLKSGAEVNATDKAGMSALTAIAQSDHKDACNVAQLLLEHDAQPRPIDLRAARGNASMTALLTGRMARH